MQRVPVLDIDGNPTMPTKASRARRWLRDGKAKIVHNDLGIFQIQLLQEASGIQQQDVVVGVDPGKLYTGMAVQTGKATLLMLHIELPFLAVKRRVQNCKMMRNSRRRKRINRKVPFKFRNHRQERFNNRKRVKLSPSILANKQLERRVIIELKKVFPITNFVFELVKAKGSASFSPVMIGQLQQLDWLISLLPTATIEGWKTSIIRDKLGFVKNKVDKSAQEPATHAVDGVALACHHFIKYIEDRVNKCADWFGDVVITDSPFITLARPPYSRRQLHKFQYNKSGKRPSYGGSEATGNFRKGDFVSYISKNKKILGYCSGSTGNRISISDSNWSRIDKFVTSKCRIIHRSCGLITKLQTTAKIPMSKWAFSEARYYALLTEQKQQTWESEHAVN